LRSQFGRARTAADALHATCTLAHSRARGLDRSLFKNQKCQFHKNQKRCNNDCCCYFKGKGISTGGPARMCACASVGVGPTAHQLQSLHIVTITPTPHRIRRKDEERRTTNGVRNRNSPIVTTLSRPAFLEPFPDFCTLLQASTVLSRPVESSPISTCFASW
jgi:hypothetical protein